MSRVGPPRDAGPDARNQRRLFVAALLPSDAARTVADLVDRVRADGESRNGRDVRWVRLDGLHVTLRFLGPTPEAAIPGITEAVRGAAADVQAFEVVVDGAGAFPSPSRPRALFLDIVEGASDLATLAGKVETGLEPLGWPRSDRPFRAHLTLARSDGVAAGPAVAARLRDAATGLRLTAAIERIGLFESQTGNGPARYEPLEVVDLG
jgi:RNA 2',3'-cyclic 3'-phosphodiesterase